ncbi:MAG: M20/M25/M40 family metallo-hydrolase [Dehalococcoidia bacterium]|jgi:acetylornithine deacetylase/succinyl-diaminopimelate desuccinylase-like protein|nr:M20/M25/M40 family metallo-hydrolase [Dehalococcoidia bacterium]
MATAYERELARLVPEVIAETVRVTEIPAPTSRERRRARYVHSRFEQIGGWDGLSIDGIGNVVAVRRGQPGKARVLVAAHLDTVFPDAETPVTRSRGRLHGRGVGDNSAGVAALLGVAQAVQSRAPRGVGDLLLAANVGEEGLGDLRGIRRIMRDHAGDFDAMIALEAHSLNRVQGGGVGSIRYEVSVRTEGGHSWGAYGRPNAISLLARAITALESVAPAVGVAPKATINAGVIRGGRSVNTIAPDASFELDMRSEDPATLDRLHHDAKRAMRRSLDGAGGGTGGGEVRLKLRRIGLRPAARMPQDHPLIGAMLSARRGLGLPRPTLGVGSTDANAPMATGMPATCIGVTTGGEAHAEREWIRTAPFRRGVPYVGRAIVAAARLPRTAVRQRRV